MDTVVIKCKGSSWLPLADLTPLQGDLKKLSDENYARLKTEMVTNGFSAPFFVWVSGDANYIMDGHQRYAALLRMQKAKIILPDLFPVAEIYADDEKQAKKKLLAIASQYGKVDEESLFDFIQSNDLGIDVLDRIDFPGVDLDSVNGMFGASELDDTLGNSDELKELSDDFIEEEGSPRPSVIDFGYM